jgi:TatD DNase family protein
MFDTHVHLNDAKLYNDLDLHIKEAKDSGVNRMMVIGYDVESSRLAVEIASKYDFVYAAIGVHPSEFKEENRDYVKEIEELINDKVVCIGEIGLDYYWTKDNKDKQKYIFEKQLKLAEEYNLPVIIHARNSIQDVYDILKKYNLKGSMHCFQGSLEMAKKFINLGFKIGIDGPITYKNNKKQIELINNLDLKDILVETDSPYLTPEPNRGKKNNPTNLIYIINKIAEIKKETPEKVIEETTKNTKEIFNI